jgi:hypothetical protein
MSFDILAQVHAFFGPVCDYALAPVARYSPFWYTPVLSTGAVAHDFGSNKKKEYPLLTRIGVTFDSLSRCIRDTVNYYNWTNVKVFCCRCWCETVDDRRNSCRRVGSSFDDSLLLNRYNCMAHSSKYSKTG